MYTRSARIDAMIETYREGAADKKCSKCGKGRKSCSKCSHEKEESMKEDGLSVDEYLAACELGIQSQSRTYIRARLDAAGMKMKGKGVKCGKGYISQGEKCIANSPGAKRTELWLGKGERNLFNAQHSLASGARVGAQRAGGRGAALGAIVGLATGKGIKGIVKNAAIGGAAGLAAGAVGGAAVRAGAKTVRAFKRSRQNAKKWSEGMDKVEAKYYKTLENLEKRKKSLTPEQFREEDERIANTYVKEADRVYNRTTTNVWSNKNEKVRDPRSGWVKASQKR